MTAKHRLLAWSSIYLELGEEQGNKWQWNRLDMNWQPDHIYNCSYAALPKWIGITAQDRSAGQKVLATYHYQTQSTQFLLQDNDLLHHSLNRDGSAICFTMQSRTPFAADLKLFDLSNQQSKELIQGRAHPRTTPAWLFDETQVVYEAMDGQLEVLDIKSKRWETLIDGQAPAVSPDGQLIAFYHKNRLFVWDRAHHIAKPLPLSSMPGNLVLTDGLSWSPDGKYLTFGVVSGLAGKEHTFYILDVARGTHQRLSAQYLRGLLILDL